MKKILVVEDDIDINGLLQKMLEKEGYEVTAAYSGTEGELRLALDTFDLMLCDLMLPGISGEELIKEVRKKYTVPIIALTAKSALDDKVNVLESGANDYVTKPFEPRELLARIKVQLRQTEQLQGEIKAEEKQELQFRRLVLNLESREATIEGHLLELTSHEFEILRVFLETPKKVFSKEALYEAVWKNGYYGEDNTISVHISNIRKKIAAITSDEYISTVWGIGYRLHL